MMLFFVIAEPLDLWRKAVSVGAIAVALLCQFELGYRRGIAKGREERR